MENIYDLFSVSKDLIDIDNNAEEEIKEMYEEIEG